MKRPDTNPFEIFRQFAQKLGITEQEAGRSLNEERNWLKHQDGPSEKKIGREEASIMLLRAVTRFMFNYTDLQSQSLMITLIGAISLQGATRSAFTGQAELTVKAEL